MMLLRLISSTHKASPAIANSFTRVLSTTPSVVSAQSSEKFFLRHQLESKHVSAVKWLRYRGASVGLLTGLACCFVCPGNAVVDFVTVSLLVYHNYAGLNSVFADYCPLFFSDMLTKMIMTVWLIISMITLGLLYSFNYTNAGFSKTLNAIFKL